MPHALPRLPDAADQHVGSLGLLADFADAALSTLERERHVAGHDRQRGDLAEIGDDVLGDAVREVFLLGVAAHVGEGQHADTDLRFLVGERLRRRRFLRCAKLRFQRLAEPAERGALAVLAPAVEVRGVHCAKIDGQLCVFEPHGHQHAAIGGVTGFTAHPARVDRMRSPDDNKGARALELPRDQRIEFFARCDLGIPPDGPAFRLERRNEWRDADFVLPRVGDENVGQQSPRALGFPPSITAAHGRGPIRGPVNPAQVTLNAASRPLFQVASEVRAVLDADRQTHQCVAECRREYALLRPWRHASCWPDARSGFRPRPATRRVRTGGCG